ncbi:hypothetical protein DEA8626_00529 [Defluviimonas aquaemixtae]|uniref:Uncharacterized protein n=1 Tax=Albidovulum aquaemixtae TaxID=1542388 RepID=A0A2R8B365_9RHOB|nr:hypothetical protein [Defluviimonas aquaemixtae]SPH17015.1 hypothetical protein DEA8626_00529 [Defluviimonas aquaemixtae]
MQFINDNQLPLILICFLIGSIFTAFLFRSHASQRAWKYADVLWVVLGGLGALTAVVAGVYTADSSQLERQIDIAYAATREFDRDAARFRLAHCEVDHPAAAFRAPIRDLCDKVEFLSASTAGNSELPLFIAVTERAAPLQGLHLFFGAPDSGADMMEKEMATFDEAEFLAFAAEDEATRAAVALLRQAPSVAGVAAEYQVIARSYEELIDEVMHLRDEWEFLQESSEILTLQVLALCLVAFAAPFRLGKSIVELR